ncbi:RNA methyltransferase substrate-binding domain-containing protein, partial [Halobacillus sp. BBL2006]|uniref:RNA methyltransferase substrate-binding domain-containing protein n=1 Tax=Halobacillus sp. BBL2006 TaxID=1543706 RepID=UPI000542E45D
MNAEWIIGKNPVQEALRSGRSINKVLVSDQLQHQASKKLEQLAKENGVIVQKVPKKKIDQLVEGNHQGVAASVAAY